MHFSISSHRLFQVDVNLKSALSIKVQNAISQDLTDRELEKLAVEENSMLTLTQYGVELVKENLTTLSEVVRVCKSD